MWCRGLQFKYRVSQKNASLGEGNHPTKKRFFLWHLEHPVNTVFWSLHKLGKDISSVNSSKYDQKLSPPPFIWFFDQAVFIRGNTLPRGASQGNVLPHLQPWLNEKGCTGPPCRTFKLLISVPTPNLCRHPWEHGALKQIHCRVETKILWRFWRMALSMIFYRLGTLYQTTNTLRLDPVSSSPTKTTWLHNSMCCLHGMYLQNQGS